MSQESKHTVWHPVLGSHIPIGNFYGSAHISPTRRVALLEAAEHKCACCGDNEDLTIDHIVPHAMCGVNEDYNLQVLCGPCNRLKGSRIIYYEPRRYASPAPE
jgi:5-methylcytosine-specific restriction endonuclease McrA